MDKRRYKGTQVNLEAEITCEGKAFTGSVKNVSEGGVGYLINSSIRDSTNFVPKSEFLSVL